jgi:3-methylcrotonyl-CoA carboxylase alpha subunit
VTRKLSVSLCVFVRRFKQLMEKPGVPLVPGYHEHRFSRGAAVRRTASATGLIKASADGGGKGMQAVDRRGLRGAGFSCKRGDQ